MNTSLPIYQVKDNIIEAVQNHQVVIIEAETGSGKSTQVPQMLFEELGWNSVSTQPRRLACISLAHRVREEMGDDTGIIVGYKTGFEDDYNEKENRILFTTDGLLVASGLNEFHNVVIIDEVHEQSLNIEILIAWAKKILMSGDTKKKFILMSATLNIEKLVQFFEEFNPVVVSCPKSPYNVEMLFNEDVSHETLVVDYATKGKNIMVFLPGKKEIEQMKMNLINMLPTLERYKIFQVHGDQTFDEQKPVFEDIAPKVKIVLCTNICQTSITISDIDVVIDTGKAKIAQIENNIKALITTDISKSDCLQRKGRVGRTKDGIYILSSHCPLNSRKKYPTPEIKRVFLSEAVLRLADIGIDAIEMEFLHNPPKESLKFAKEECISLGALTKNGTITPLGKKISKLPLDVRTARMLIEAEKYGGEVIDSMIKISAISQVGSLLYHGKDGGHYSNFTKEKESDLLAELDIFEYIRKESKNNKFFDWKSEGLNEKSYLKAEEYYEKIRKMEWEEPTKIISSKEEIREAMINCILLSMKDYIFDFRHQDINPWDFYDDYYEPELKKDNQSCVRSNLVVGTPRVIQFEKAFHGTSSYSDNLPETSCGTLKLVTNLTAVSEKQLQKIFADEITQNIDLEYDIFSDSFKLRQADAFIASKHGDTVYFKVNYPKEIKREHKKYNEAYQLLLNKDKANLGEDFLESRKINICGKDFILHYLYAYTSSKGNKLLKRQGIKPSKLLDLKNNIKSFSFLKSKDNKPSIYIDTNKPKEHFEKFPFIFLTENDINDSSLVNNIKNYNIRYIEDKPLLFFFGKNYSKDIKIFFN